MIRTVRIPLTAGRLAQTPFVDESIHYMASTCTQTDPATGLCIADVFLPDTGGGTGASSGPGTLPGDPGLSSALQQFALTTNAQSSNDALNSLLLTTGAGNPASSPIPGPGLGLVTLPNSLQTILKWAAVGLIAFLILGQQHASISRSRR